MLGPWILTSMNVFSVSVMSVNFKLKVVWKKLAFMNLKWAKKQQGGECETSGLVQFNSKFQLVSIYNHRGQ